MDQIRLALGDHRDRRGAQSAATLVADAAPRRPVDTISWNSPGSFRLSDAIRTSRRTPRRASSAPRYSAFCAVSARELPNPVVVAAGAGQDRVLGGHHEHPGVLHHRSVSRRKVAVFDAAHPGPNGAPDTLVAVTMWGDRDFRSVAVATRMSILLSDLGVPGVVRRQAPLVAPPAGRPDLLRPGASAAPAAAILDIRRRPFR